MQPNHDPNSMDSPQQAITYTRGIGDFIPLALVNLVLTIITLGIYRFWAKTRVRRKLWSNTSFAGEALEYRGTGGELLVGALLALLLVTFPVVIISTVAAGFLRNGATAAAIVSYLSMILFLFYIIGVGQYRSHRYLLSRTSWRGIRGGMLTGGWRYGLSFLGYGIVQLITFGIASPTVQTRQWNLLWNDARFGSFEFRADAHAKGLYPRFLLSLLASFAAYGVAIALFWSSFSALATFKPGAQSPEEMLRALVPIYAALIGVGIAVALIMASYYAAMLRTLFGSTSVGGLTLGFPVTTSGIISFYVGNVLIIVLTLGLGIIVLPYRNWTFYVRHLTAAGTLDANALAQSTLAGPTQGDGIADAFDMSAF